MNDKEIIIQWFEIMCQHWYSYLKEVGSIYITLIEKWLLVFFNSNSVIPGYFNTISNGVRILSISIENNQT